MIRHRKIKTWDHTIDVLELTGWFGYDDEGHDAEEFELLVCELIWGGTTAIRVQCGQLEAIDVSGACALLDARCMAVQYKVRFAYDYQGNAEARRVIRAACYGDVGDIGSDDDDGAGCFSPLIPPPGFGSPSVARPLGPDVGDDAG